jgi:hypothetical protein
MAEGSSSPGANQFRISRASQTLRRVSGRQRIRDMAWFQNFKEPDQPYQGYD